jgi:two-component system chemotaxis sensor kinase CheA
MDDIVNDFLVESFEGLDQLDRDLVALESAPTDGELLARVFRCVHTVKGTCGFLGFGKLESVAHVGESLLAKLRDGELVLDSARTSALLSLVDAIRQILCSIESSGQEGDADYSALIARLEGLLAPEQPESKGQPNLRQGDEVAGHPQAGAELGEAQAEARANAGSATDSSIRVDVGLLDRLMNLVGELVLARNQILQHATAEQGGSLAAASQRLNLLTTELQEGVMKTRMQPIGNIWGKLPRVVRDLAVACNKQIRLEMEGKETELDKTIIEAIKDPLTHIVRNSADHGIETPEVRIPRGKPAEGRLSLRAYHEGGQVIIEIADDGAGIDAERIKQKAVEKGLISADQAARMGEREALNLVFLPGLSTARQVTNISGRGVGMDVVKSNIEKIGGAVDIQSKPGVGTTLKIKIPLTLAIIPALVVSCNGNRYAIPQVNLVELVRRERRESRECIEMIHGAPVYRLRGNLLPLVYLRSALDSTGKAARNDALNVVVLQADDRTFGLVVDEINDTEEIVVKPLGKQLKGLTAFAGATIMGDGRVALILDVMGLAQRAHVISEVRERRAGEHVAPVRATLGNRQALLVCALGDTRRAAIPLSSVARLEEFPASSVEHAGEYDVVQYRGQILALLDLPGILGVSSVEPRSGMLPVVVYAANGRNVGFVVGRILDIVEDEVHVDVSTTREGMLGSIVVQQRVTDVLDMGAIVRNAAPWLIEGVVAMENAA